ncbi:MAG TPA: DUF6763 family protein [Woeseiaceae bacterium]|nr:DUF6763 family protein [Woeseiaceae bacterium]
MTAENPVIGRWYRYPDGRLFEVVAVDEKDATVELQHFDGTLDEVELATWTGMLIESVGAPEDCSGSLDMDPEDYSGASTGELPHGWHDPLGFLDQTK